MAKILISKDGKLKFIYEDKLRSLLYEGKAQIKRASHVEPTEDNQWMVDLTPVSGPRIGPFIEREKALEAEVEWLNKHLGEL